MGTEGAPGKELSLAEREAARKKVVTDPAVAYEVAYSGKIQRDDAAKIRKSIQEDSEGKISPNQREDLSNYERVFDETADRKEEKAELKSNIQKEISTRFLTNEQLGKILEFISSL
jgi:hypothetical protein